MLFHLNFSSNYFIADDSHVKIVWFYVIVFAEQHSLNFHDNVTLLKYYPVTVPRNCFNSFSC